MEQTVKSLNMAINQIDKRLDEQYRLWSVHWGISDPALWVLYVLCETDDTYTQQDLANMWSYPKQTVNFTISKLQQKGYLRLEQIASARNSKAIRLTEEGRAFCEEAVIPLMKAEQRSLLRMPEEERRLMVELQEKQCRYFEEEIQALIGPKNNKKSGSGQAYN